MGVLKQGLNTMNNTTSSKIQGLQKQIMKLWGTLVTVSNNGIHSKINEK